MTLRITTKNPTVLGKHKSRKRSQVLGQTLKLCLQLLAGRKPKPITILVDLSIHQSQHAMLELNCPAISKCRKTRKGLVDQHNRSLYQPPRSRVLLFLLTYSDSLISDPSGIYPMCKLINPDGGSCYNMTQLFHVFSMEG